MERSLPCLGRAGNVANETLISLSDSGPAVSRSLLQGAEPAACCVAEAAACCPAGTACYPPYGCVVAQTPVTGQAVDSAAEKPVLGLGLGTMSTVVIAVLVTACLCLVLSLCCVKQLCSCLCGPGPDGEFTGAQMGMVGLAGAAAGYELENMMDGYGGGYGGPRW